MPRQKNERNISFHPSITDFIPKNNPSTETIHLLSDEVEALYLMDLLELYQEDAAKKMNISRPTFARIIKSARQKVSLALLLGKNLNLATNTQNYTVAFCCTKEDDYTNLSVDGDFIAIFTIENNLIVKKLFIENPVKTKKAKPPLVIPNICMEYGVNYFVIDKIGEGLKNSLFAKGIMITLKSEFILNQFIKSNLP